MGTYGNPRENKVCVDWLGKNEKCTKYFKKVGNKKLSFIGSQETLKEAEEIKKFRRGRYKRQTIIKKLGGEYLIYSE